MVHVGLLGAAALLAKNVICPIFLPAAGEATVMRLSRLLVVAVMGAALLSALLLPGELVGLLILGYDGVCQLFPGVVAGLLTGVGVALALILSGNDPVLGLNAGFVALAANALVTVVVSLLTRPSEGSLV